MGHGATTLNISLPEALKERVQRRVAEGAFSNASDFVRALIRLDKEQQEKLAALRGDIAVGIDQLDRGEGHDGERVFAESWTRGRSDRIWPRSYSLAAAGRTLERIRDHTAKDNPRAAPRVVTRLREVARMLAGAPAMGRRGRNSAPRFDHLSPSLMYSFIVL